MTNTYIRPADICAVCGKPVPEGKMICWECEHKEENDGKET